MNLSAIWGIVTVVVLIAELLTGTMFLYVLAGSAMATTIYTFFVETASFNAQLICFSLSSAVLFFFILRIVKKGNKPLAKVNNPGAQFLGRTLTLSSDVVGGHGSILINDAPWQIRGPDLVAGSRVVVNEVKNGVLYYMEADDG